MRFFYLFVAAAVAAAIVSLIVKRTRRDTPVGQRQQQRTEDGTSVVDEWGEESFPASDAPQSW